MVKSYIHITSAEFAEKVLNAQQLVVVNFSAEQSNSCQMQEPEFEAVSKHYQDKVLCVLMNLTGNEELFKTWNIDGVPILVFFKGGIEIYRINGIMMRDKLRRQIEGVLLH